MELRPTANKPITINGRGYTFSEHPVAKGMPYGQSGRRATVYQLRAPDGRFHAIKIFTQAYRDPRVAEGIQQLEPHAAIPGLQVCRRQVLTADNHPQLCSEFENLTYSVVMPWVFGETWQEFLLSKRPLSQTQSRTLAQAFVSVLAAMEAKGIAHCDISGPNVLLPGVMPLAQRGGQRGEGENSIIALVDVEDMFVVGTQKPPSLPAGSSGYAHRTAPGGVWSDDGDRFSGAVLLAEMLGWCDDSVRQVAYGEQYFDMQETQQNSDRYQILQKALRSHFGPKISDLFSRAWESTYLSECPRLSEWKSLLGEAALDAEAIFQPGAGEDSRTELQESPVVLPVKQISPQETLARASIERAAVFASVGQMDRAIKELEEAYHFAPDIGGKELAKALLRIAEGKERTGDLNGALNDYRRALAVAPPGGLRDELQSIVGEVTAKVEMARGAMGMSQNTMAAPRSQPPPAYAQQPQILSQPSPPSVIFNTPPPPVYTPPVYIPEEKPKRRWWNWVLLLGGGLALLGCLGGIALYVLSPETVDIAGLMGWTPTPMTILTPTTSFTPTAEALPGKEVIPVEQMAAGNPWLSLDKAQAPTTRYIAFNTRMTPFDKPLVRKAFAAAIHRQGVATFASQLYKETYSPATTFTPPTVLGRDLYREVGINYNLEQARKFLFDAGFPNGEGLPAIALSITSCQDNTSPNSQIANYLVDMWSQAGIVVTVNCIKDPAEFSQLKESGALQLYITGWAADYNDPDNFLKGVFYSSSQANHGYFADGQFDQLVNKAAELTDPAERQRLYVQAEKILTGEQAALIPLYFYTTDSNAPVPTEAPVAVGDTIFTDDFSSNGSGWTTGDEDDGKWAYEDSGFAILVKKTGYMRWVTPPIDFKPTSMEVDAWVPDSHKKGTYGYFGVLCRYQDGDNFYFADIDTEEKTYQIGIKKDGEFSYLTDLKPAGGMKPLPFDTNHILFECTGDDISLFINDQNQEIVTNDSLPQEGEIGFYVATYDKMDAKGFKMIFDNFSTWKPVQ